jgi:hypothetical protein
VTAAERALVRIVVEWLDAVCMPWPVAEAVKQLRAMTEQKKARKK